MKRILVVLAVCLAVASVARGDGGFFPPRLVKDHRKGDLAEPAQRAVIVHHHQMETMMLFVDYRGGAERFAWIVPVPSMPRVTTTDTTIFREVAEYYHGLQMAAWRARGGGTGGPMLFGVGGGRTAVPRPERPKVTVLKASNIGGYEIAVLSSKSGGDLRRWLVQNEFRVPEGMDDVLQAYVEEKWYFVAVKVRTDGDEDKQVTLTPLRIDFQTKEVVYPLRISAANRGVTNVIVYLLKRTHEPGGTLGPGNTDSAFKVGKSIYDRCPRLVRAVPGAYRKAFYIYRIEEELVPQIMRRMHDHIRDDLAGATMSRTLGIVEALVSSNAAEAQWALRNLRYFKPRDGRLELPAEQLAELRRLGSELEVPLREALLKAADEFLAGPWFAKSWKPATTEPDRTREMATFNRQSGAVQGAAALMGELGLSGDAKVTAWLDRLAKVPQLRFYAERVRGLLKKPAAGEALRRARHSR